MFYNIPPAMQARMSELERIDARDRTDGTTRLRRLRQIPPQTGRFLALLAANTPAGEWVEIGASAGYSTLWLALAALQRPGQKIVTFEMLPEKAAMARETFAAAQVEDRVELIEGDARATLDAREGISFCFLDAEKDSYLECYELVVPKLVSGGLLVADNALNHREALGGFLQRAQIDPRVDALIVPIGKGELICRKP
jgi:caffeoyl-CoA O-methyltransferase